MTRTLSVLCAVALVTALRLPAQARDSAASHDAPSWRRGAVHYGKWVAAAAAVTLTALGAHQHDNSNRQWTALLAVCRANNADCLLGPDGRYLNPTAEGLYQSSLDFDRRARARLLGAQAALLVTATLFIVDLRSHEGAPGNVPYAPLKVSGDGRTGRTLVGLRVTF